MKIEITKLRYLFATAFVALTATAQAQLLNETFDSSAGFTITDGNDASATFFSDGGFDFFGIFDGDGDGGEDFGVGATPTVDAYTGFGDNYLANTDMDGDGPVLPYTLTWSGIALSGETFLEVSADFASSQADSDDYIIISYRLDGDAWTDVLGIAGENGVNNGSVYEITDFNAGTGDPGATALSLAATNIGGSFSLAGTESTLDIKAEFSNNNGFDNFAMDNLVVLEGTPPVGPQTPTGVSASPSAAPNNKDQIEIDYTADGSSNDVLIVFNTVDSFGTPVDTTAYSAGDSIVGGGTVAGTFSSSPATVSGLAPGTTYYFVVYSVDGSNTYSNGTSTLTVTTDSYAFQLIDFDDWTAIDMSGDDSWFVNGDFASCNGFGGTNPEEDWLISPAINLDLFASETFEFDYRSTYVDPLVPGLELFYSTDYAGDTSTATWIPLTTQNTDFDTNKSTTNSTTDYFSTSLDLSGISGTSVYLGFKYTTGSDATDARDWDLQNPLVSGNGASDEAITLSATPATVDEGQSRTVTLSVPSNVGSDTEFFLSSNGDGSELSFPASVTILNGNNSINFSVSGLADSGFDPDNDIELVANRAGYTLDSLTITVNNVDAQPTAGDIVISQYYEGSSNNKYLEITNISDSPVDLTGYTLVRWGNARAEEYKTATEAPVDDYDTLDLTTLGTLAAGQTVVIANASAASPISAGDADLSQGFPGAVTFNGNDSVVIYNSTNPNPANIVDAIGFTDDGKEGANTSFVRASAFQGYDLTPESNATSAQFASVWTQVNTSTVDAATSGDDEFLGSSDLTIPPTTVSFSAGSQVVAEADGSFDLTVEITGLTAGVVVVDVDFNGGNSTVDDGDFTFTSPKQLTFDASNLTNPQTITVPIADDGADSAIVEVASFDLSISSGTAIVGSPSTQNVSIQDSDAAVPNIFISEIVDPSDSAADGRYVELYNPTASPVDLGAGNWNLVIYFNANTGGQDIALTGTIPAGGTFVIAESDDFGLVYTGVTSDQTGNVNSNGDDNFELRFGGDHSGGILVDVYGQPGTDGSGFPWEFTDSRAYRNSSVTSGNTSWTESEWTIEATDVVTGNMTPDVHPDDGGPSLPTYPITEDFSGTSTWVSQTVTGSYPWQIDGVDERAEADGFADGASTENHYLVSPAFDFTASSDITFSFNYGEAFDGPDLELLYSTNYSGTGDPEAAGVVWTPVTFTFTDSSIDENFSSSASGNVSLPASLNNLTGVYFAFKYTADGTEAGSEQWFIDDIIVDATVTAPDPLGDYLTLRSLSSGDLYTDVNDNGFTVLEEYLAGFGDGSGSDTIIYGVDLDGKVALTLVSDRDDEPEDITISLLATSDLGVAFTPVSFDYSVIENLDGTFTHTYEETTPPVVDQRFLRLQILED